MENIVQPLLILHGTNDGIGNVNGSKSLHKRAQSKDKTLKLYKNLYHELLNEPEKDQVIQDILSWIAERA
jgi:alpha-beta hydrolase superfamily lysophospholipase